MIADEPPNVANDHRGEIGQTAFHTLCLEARATPNRPQLDKFGWDTHVTLHVGRQDRGPLELRETERRLMIQVKARTPEDWSVPLRLSNAERMVKEVVPWFLFVARFPIEALKATEFFLVHVDEDFVARVLKRLRELDRDLSAKANEHDIIIPFYESDRIQSGDQLRARWLEALLRADHDYCERKHKWRESVGFDDARYRGTFRVRAPSRSAMFEQMADFKLGLAPLKVDTFELSKVRFGIPSDPIVHRDTTLEVPDPPSAGDSLIEFFDAANEERAQFQMATHTTAGIPRMPVRHHRIRLVGPHLVVTVHKMHRKHPSLSLDIARPELDAEVDLLTAQHVGALVDLIRRHPERGMHVRLQMPSLNAAWEFELRNIPPVEEPAIELFGRTARAAARLFSEFGFDARGASARVGALIHDWPGLNLVAAARRPKPEIDRVGVAVRTARPPKGTVATFAPRFALPTSRGVMVGYAVLVGEVRHPRSKTRIEVVKPRVTETMVKLVGDVARRTRVEAEIDGAIEALRRSYEIVIG